QAREHLEALRWPDSPDCPHCGEAENVTRLDGESHRPGLIQCNACRKNFSVTVGTLFERSHIPLNKWMLAFHLVAASKKAMSAHQMHRQLDVTYKTAWFMMHRIREAMATPNRPKLGGEGKIIEADETFWGMKPGGQPKKGYHHKNAVVALVERSGEVRAFHVPSATAQSVRKVLNENGLRRSARHMEGADLAATLDQRDNGVLVVIAFLRLTARLHAPKRLVGFDDLPLAAELGAVRRGHRFADTVHHEPRGLVGHVELAVHLVRAHGLFARRDEMEGQHPLVERDVRALEQGANRDAEVLAAGIALDQAGAVTLA